MNTRSASDTVPDPGPDPIDQLIPAPRRWWVRLTVGLSIVLVVGFGSALVGFGYVYPRPECCGSGSGSATMTLTPDGQAVTVQAYVFNSSGRDLVPTAGSARGRLRPARPLITRPTSTLPG